MPDKIESQQKPTYGKRKSNNTGPMPITQRERSKIAVMTLAVSMLLRNNFLFL